MMGHAWLKHREALLAVVIILMIGAIGSRAPSFVSPGNLVEMFNDTAILIILALGQMMVLLTKGIDLSMAANLALTGMIVALLNAHYPGIPVVALLALATLLGLLMGVINGLLVWRLGIPAIVVTLGTMSIYRGIIFLLTDGGWVNSHQMSADFLSLPRSPLLGLPLLSWCAIAALLWWVISCATAAPAGPYTPRAATRRRHTTPALTPGKCSSSASVSPARWPASAAICGSRASPSPMSTSPTVLNSRWSPPA
ncbi:L-rhamnose ABC transporter, transmembrane component 2 [Klebsiella pneumoniae]|nr:L-rhamnose ABC transporter, transmembrane component 2 [Klebsiella pneumoniae]